MLNLNSNSMILRITTRRLLTILLLVAVVSLVVVEPVMACPTCKEAVAENGQSQAGLVRGYFWSILFMMSMPFLIFCGLAYYFGWQVRKAREQQLLAAAGEAVVAAAVIDADGSRSLLVVEQGSDSSRASAHHHTLLHP